MDTKQKEIASEAVAAILREAVCERENLSAGEMKTLAVGAAKAILAAFAELDSVSSPCS